MDNQHKLIKGYRDLSQPEIDLMNHIKEKESEMMALIWKVRQTLAEQQELSQTDKDLFHRLQQAEPARWCAMAKSHFQEGFMELVRSVAQPQSPNGNSAG